MIEGYLGAARPCATQRAGRRAFRRFWLDLRLGAGDTAPAVEEGARDQPAGVGGAVQLAVRSAKKAQATSQSSTPWAVRASLFTKASLPSLS